ncbi:MAG: ABC-type transport auxiliary lipoprotein family protein, partial [Desulfobulbaceae bacterium]|nr:ABC-type transport auxiliary lipoprotein family protein [Desulfobulbaceae bacterium]
AFLQAAGAADQVLLLEPDLRSDLLLEVRINRFEQLLAADGSQVAVALTFTGRAPGKQPWSREYSVQARVEGASLQETVAAYGQALERIYTMLLRDVAAGGGS